MFLQNESLTERIRKTYERLGKFSSLYDGMITNSSFMGRLAMRFFWGLSDEDYQRFLNQAFAGIPKNLSGRLLEIPGCRKSVISRSKFRCHSFDKWTPCLSRQRYGSR